MGVIALGIGFATPLALAGVAVHIVGHAVAKALGFYAATPLLGHEPAPRVTRSRDRADAARRSAATMGISLGTLAGLPPSPLFLSEILIVAGGFQAGRSWAAAGAAVMLALGFVGLAHALVETTGGRARRRDRQAAPGLRAVMALGAASTVDPARSRRRRLLAPGHRHRRGAGAGHRVTVRDDRGTERRSKPLSTDGCRAAGPPRLGAAGRSCGSRCRRPTARSGSNRPPSRTGPFRSIVDLAPPPPGTSARRTTCYGVRFDGHEPLRPLVDHDLVLASLDRAGARRRRVPGRRRPDPRRRDRVRALPLPRRRRPDPPPRCASLLQAPRSRAGSGGSTLAEGARYVGARVRGLRRRERLAYAHACEEASGSAPTPSSRACGRSCSSSNACGATSTTSRRSAPGSVSPPGTRSSPRSPSAHGASTHASPATASCSAPSPSGAARSSSTPRRCAAAREELEGIGARRTRLARAAVQHLVPGPTARDRRHRGGGRRAARDRRSGGARRRRRGRHALGDAAARLRGVRAARPRAARGRRPCAARAARARARAVARAC